jgi:hypothetical protein
MSQEEKDKATKKLNKKLKQIEKLKGMAAKGEEMNADQKEKLAMETDIVAQIAKINAA